MKLFRKILIYMLSLVLVVTPVFLSYSQTVYAAQAAEIIDGVKKALRVLSFMLSSTGTVVSTERVQNFYETYKERIDTILTGGVTVTEKGEYICSGASVEEIRALFDEYLSSTPEILDVVWMPVISSDKISANFFNTVSGYQKIRSWADDTPLGIISGNMYRVENESDGDCRESGGRYYQRLVTVQSLDNIVFLYQTVDPWSSFVELSKYWTSIFGTNPSTSVGSVRRLLFYTSDGVNSTCDDFVFHAMTLVDNDVYSVSSNSALTFCTNYSLYYPYTPVLLQPYGSSSSPFGIMFRGCNTDAPAYVPVFKNINAYRSWITGQGNYYKFDSGYTGGDITINPDADYSQITNAIQNAMQQAVQSGKNMTDALSDMQKAFTTALNKLNGTLEDIEDNTNAANEWLEKIYNKLVEVYGEDAADTWLEMNENLDRIYEKLNEIYSEDESAAFNILIDSVRGTRNLLLLFYDRNHDDIEHFELVFEAVLSGVVGKLEESNTWLEKIYNRVDDIYGKVKAILFVDTVDAAFDIFSKVWDSITEWIENKYEVLGIMTEAAQVGNVMKTKFPFSIPWDVYAILMMFDAPAKPPVISLHWEMPFLGEDYAFDYEYTMDEQMWINLSAVCRFFLIVSYDITLIHLTQKLYAAGLFDIPSIGRKKR